MKPVSILLRIWHYRAGQRVGVSIIYAVEHASSPGGVFVHKERLA